VKATSLETETQIGRGEVMTSQTEAHPIEELVYFTFAKLYPSDI
jgi:hypothetical protein